MGYPSSNGLSTASAPGDEPHRAAEDRQPAFGRTASRLYPSRRSALHGYLSAALGLTDQDDRYRYANRRLGREVTRFGCLTDDEVQHVFEAAQRDARASRDARTRAGVSRQARQGVAA